MRFSFLLIILLLPFNGNAAPLLLGCGDSLPPHVIPQTERGIALDVIRRAFQRSGNELEVKYDTHSKLIDAFNHQQLDILCVSNSGATPDAFFSRYPILIFQNEGITLKRQGISLVSAKELSHHRVGAFNLARELLPAPFKASVNQSPLYREYDQQEEQVADLFNGELDVIIIDQMIFRYYLSKLRRANPKNPELKQAASYHRLFPQTHYFAAFHSEALRDTFDAGMQALHENGEYERIVDSYQQLLSDYLFR